MPSTIYAYVNGKFVPETEARVSIHDRGFLYGHGCFETMRVYDGQIFRVGDHLARLAEGLTALRIEALFSPAELTAICRALIRYNRVTSGVARIYQTPDSLIVTVQPREFVPREIRAVVSTIRVDPQLSVHKTANRLPYLLAQHEARVAGVDESVLLGSDGQVVEFSVSNLFVVKDGVLITPPLTDSPLPGITRQAVLALATELKIPAEQRSFAPSFLDTADEVFAANSLIEIAPVVTWGRQRAVTIRLQKAYRELVASELSKPGP